MAVGTGVALEGRTASNLEQPRSIAEVGLPALREPQRHLRHPRLSASQARQREAPRPGEVIHQQMAVILVDEKIDELFIVTRHQARQIHRTRSQPRVERHGARGELPGDRRVFTGDVRGELRELVSRHHPIPPRRPRQRLDPQLERALREVRQQVSVGDGVNRQAPRRVAEQAVELCGDLEPLEIVGGGPEYFPRGVQRVERERVLDLEYRSGRDEVLVENFERFMNLHRLTSSPVIGACGGGAEEPPRSLRWSTGIVSSPCSAVHCEEILSSAPATSRHAAASVPTAFSFISWVSAARSRSTEDPGYQESFRRRRHQGTLRWEDRGI